MGFRVYHGFRVRVWGFRICLVGFPDLGFSVYQGFRVRVWGV